MTCVLPALWKHPGLRDKSRDHPFNGKYFFSMNLLNSVKTFRGNSNSMVSSPAAMHSHSQVDHGNFQRDSLIL